MSVEDQKNLFPATAKSNISKGRSKRNSNLMLNNSRNPSVGDSRYSSSLITVKKPGIKSRLFKSKKAKKSGTIEMYSNKSTSSIRNTSTRLYMFRQGNDYATDKSKEKLSTHENLKKTITMFYDRTKKSKTKSKKKRTNSKKKSGKKKDASKDIRRPGSALGYIRHKNLRSNSNKSKHLRHNDSLYLEKFRSKENTIRYDEPITFKPNFKV
jgi:predicted nuclease of restriction endonuclease-like (RecB) superfamily